MTPLIRDISAASAEHHRLLDQALGQCRNSREIDQCERAYAHEWFRKLDTIQQSHGMTPMAFKMELIK